MADIIPLRMREHPTSQTVKGTASAKSGSASKEGRRARSAPDKRARADNILDAAEALFLEGGADLPTVAQIAEAAGVAKGTVYLYFGTKEEVFLARLQQHTAIWVDKLYARIRDAKGAITPSDMANWHLSYPLKNPVALQLAAISAVALEGKVSREMILRYKLGQIERLSRLGVVTSLKSGSVSEEAATALHLRSYAHLLGVWQLANPPSACREVMDLPELAPLNVDFETAARADLTALWRDALS